MRSFAYILCLVTDVICVILLIWYTSIYAWNIVPHRILWLTLIVVVLTSLAAFLNPREN